MSELSVEKITNKTGTGPTDFADGLTVDGSTLESNYGFVPMTLIESNGTPADSASNRGNLWWNDSDGTLAIYNNNAWLGISGEVSAGGGASAFAWGGDRGIVLGGSDGSNVPSDIIQYFDYTTSGNALDFGDLPQGRDYTCSVSSTNRVVTATGLASNDYRYNWMDYVTPSTTGNSTNFGTLPTYRQYAYGTGNGTYGLIAGGDGGTTSGGTDANGNYGTSPFANLNTIEYITIATTGNGLDFGDLTATSYFGAGVSDSTRSCLALGYAGGTSNAIDYVTIDTPGNGTDFGDLTASKYYIAGCSDTTRGLIGGGFSSSALNVIEYITIQTAGNGTDFGDLTDTNLTMSSHSNDTYGSWNGGWKSGVGVFSKIDIVTIQTAGNATDHGDLTASLRTFSSGSGDPS